jgi:cell division protein FtsB
MMGLGITEIAIFLIVAFFALIVPIGVVCLVLFLVSRNNATETQTMSQLQAENQRLREQLATLQNKMPS